MAEILLVNGGSALIDDADVALVSQHRWWQNTGAAVTVVNGETVLMHRLLLGFAKGNPTSVDHANGDRLDNRRVNLRPCTHAENMKNRRMHRNNRTGFKGVIPGKRAGTYEAQIRVDGKKYRLGVFSSAADAHVAYMTAAKKYHGEFARI